jgi:tRNA-dihydrouridine synthase
LIEAMVRALDVPVTVKLRSGWDEDSTNALAVGIGAQNAGAAAVTLHPRSRKKLYSGTADWGLVTELAKHLTIPVIGSGDIISPEDERAVFASSGAAGFMIGRGALHNPFIFSELAAARNGMRRPEASEAERLALLHQYADLLAQDLPSRAHLGRMKNFANRMTVRWSDAALRRSLLRSATVPELLEQARRGFAQRAA